MIYFTKLLTKSVDNNICKNKLLNSLYSRLFKTSSVRVLSYMR